MATAITNGASGGGGAPSGPPVGLLANGALFVPPSFYNLPHFGYANLDDQMKDAMAGWQQGAGVFGGNNVPKYNGLPGSGPNGTFGGGFATMQPNVGGSTYGKTAYSGGFDPFKGRGLLSGGGAPPGTPPGTGAPPGAGAPPGTSVPSPGAGAPNPPGGIAQPGLGGGSVPNNTSTVGPGVGGITGLLGGATGPIPPKVGMGAGGQPPYPNTFTGPQNPATGTLKTSQGVDAPNPFGLTTEQVYWALSGHPDAARRLMESLGAAGGQSMQNGQLVMTPENQLFHQIMNYYEAGGGGFNTVDGVFGGYTAQDAFNAAKSYAQGMGETTYNSMPLPSGAPMFANMAEAKAAGYW